MRSQLVPFRYIMRVCLRPPALRSSGDRRAAHFVRQNIGTLITIMKKNFSKNYQQGQAPSTRSGQAMIMTVLVLSSIVLSLSSIGGYLMLVRLRINSDIGNTMRAIYIADAGLECEAYNHFKNNDTEGYCADQSRNVFFRDVVADGERFYYETAYDKITASSSAIRSIGNARNVNRSFRLDF